MPFCPLGYPATQREAILTNPVVNSVAAAHDASAAQVALAWLLAIARNTAFSWLDKNRSSQTVSIQDLDAVDRIGLERGKAWTGDAAANSRGDPDCEGRRRSA